jgi:hypothetical protein
MYIPWMNTIVLAFMALFLMISWIMVVHEQFSADRQWLKAVI